MDEKQLEELIIKFIYKQRAEWRLYPDIYAKQLAKIITTQGFAVAWQEGHSHCFHVERPYPTPNPYKEIKSSE